MTRVWPPTLLWTLLCWSYCTRLAPRVAGQEQQPKPKPRVAVVGAGIGGSSAAFFLRESVGEDVDIVVFDKAEKPGGRTDDFVFDGQTLEVGASIIYTGNAHLFNLTERVGLKRVEPKKAEGLNTGLWDGKQFVLTTTDSGFFNLLKMAWRYGRSLLKINSLVREALVNFDRIYELQAKGSFFSTPEELWGEVGLLALTKMTISEYLHKRLGRKGSPVEVELAHAANTVNYNQDNSLNALAGVVSLCPAVTGDLFKVEGGNSRLSQELLKAATSQLRLSTSVTGVVGSAKEGYSVYGDRQEKLGTFDAVIIAVPMSLAGISLDVRKEDGEAETLRQPLPPVRYQEVHTTFVRGIVDKSYFGLRPGDDMPASVLLTEKGAVDSPFSSLALHTHTGVPSQGVYKLFSRRELWTGALDRVFIKGAWDILHHREWRAYPVHTPAEAFAPSNLFPGHPVWYTSALEEGVSAMEILVIAAKNAALGVTEALRPKLRSHEGRKSSEETVPAVGEASTNDDEL